MRLLKLEIDNVMRLRAVRLSPDGKSMVVGGANGAGKSSLLRSIEMLFGGKGSVPDEPVRKGAKKAQIIGETEEYIITRRFDAKGGTDVEVTTKDGARIPSPQALLGKLYDDLSFDPLAFDRMSEKEQAEILRRLVGLDFSKEDAKRDEAYGKRTDVGRELRRLQGALDKMPEPPASTPDAEVSVTELATELERRQKANAGKAELRRQLSELRSFAKQTAAHIEKLEAELDLARKQLEELNTTGPALRAKVDTQGEDEDLDEVRTRIAGAEQANRNVRAKLERAKLEAELDAATDESERLTQYIAEIDGIKADAAAKAKYPVQGLEATSDGVRLNGVPFRQGSQAERLRASVAIGAALKSGLRVMLIKDGALLDDASMRLLEGIAEEFDLQAVVEVVGDRKECTVIISDGEVSETRPSQEAAAAS